MQLAGRGVEGIQIASPVRLPRLPEPLAGEGGNRVTGERVFIIGLRIGCEH